MTEEQAHTCQLYRDKAEELRTTATEFHSVSAKADMEKTARIWEQLADTIEHRT